MARTASDAARAALYVRAGSRCERCGLYRNGGLHVSHRQPRGMGGALGRRVLTHDRLANLNLLCGYCHLGFVEQSIRESTAYGWRVPRGFQPEDFPVLTWRGWAYLTNDGEYTWPPIAQRHYEAGGQHPLLRSTQ